VSSRLPSDGQGQRAMGRAMIYGKKGLEIKPFASDDSAASSSKMVGSVQSFSHIWFG
jgi:hypothetical protein